MPVDGFREREAEAQINDGIGNLNRWTATAAAPAGGGFDYDPGTSVVITVTQFKLGLPPEADAVHVKVYDEGVEIHDFGAVENPPHNRTVTLFFNHNALSSGTPAASTLEIVIQATKGGVGGFDVSSRGTPDTPPPGGYESHLFRGYVRNRTTATVTTTNQGGTEPAIYAVNDTINHKLTWGHRTYRARTFSVAVSGATPALTASTPSTVGPVWDTTFATAVTNRFPAASTTQSATWTVPNSFAGLPLVSLTTNTADSLTIDPRVTLPHRFQINQSTWAGTDVASGSRHGGQLGFLGVTAINARGEGVNGLSVTDKLWDTDELVGNEASPVKTATNTTRTVLGVAGRTATTTGDKLPIAFDNQLPRTPWTAKATLNGSTVTGLERDNTRMLSLTAEPPVLDAFGLALSDVLTLR